jgi:hypothetical protein
MENPPMRENMPQPNEERTDSSIDSERTFEMHMV